MIKKLFISILLCSSLAACAVTNTASVGRSFDASQRLKIQKHITTQTQVVNLLGQPTNKYFNDQQKETWVYQSGDVTGKQNVWTGSETGSIHVLKLVILFNKEGKVDNYLYSDSTVPVNLNSSQSF